MKNFCKFILFIATLLFMQVFAQDSVVQELEKEIRQELQLAYIQPPSVIQKFSNYIHSVKGSVVEAREELKANNNRRPSTEYSVDDIVFSIAHLFPNWMYPQYFWKQDSITRRRNIAKVLRSSPLVARPRVTRIRDEATAWAQDSLNLIANDYTQITIDDLSSLLKSAEDFVTSATDVELMDPLFLTTGYVTLDDAVSNFIRHNNDHFNSVLDQTNKKFNSIVNVSGDLRRSLESIRDDAIDHTKAVRNELFTTAIEPRLRQLSYNIRTKLQNLVQEVGDIQDAGASKLVRQHTAAILRDEVETAATLALSTTRTKAHLAAIWETSARELTQSPLTMDYWVDTLAEVREAFVALGDSLVKRYRHRNSNSNNDSNNNSKCSCTCK